MRLEDIRKAFYAAIDADDYRSSCDIFNVFYEILSEGEHGTLQKAVERAADDDYSRAIEAIRKYSK